MDEDWIEAILFGLLFIEFFSKELFESLEGNDCLIWVCCISGFVFSGLDDDTRPEKTNFAKLLFCVGGLGLDSWIFIEFSSLTFFGVYPF